MYSKEDLLFLVPDAPLSEKGTGNYAKKVMIIMQAEPAFAGWKLFLEKLLGAAGIQLDQDARLYTLDAGTVCLVSPEIKSRQPDQVLIFGVTPGQLGLHIITSKYKPLFFCNTTMVFADTLAVLEPDKALKTQMWTAMKAMFKIS